jgi:hypothetical protein
VNFFFHFLQKFGFLLHVTSILFTFGEIQFS